MIECEITTDERGNTIYISYEIDDKHEINRKYYAT